LLKKLFTVVAFCLITGTLAFAQSGGNPYPWRAEEPHFATYTVRCISHEGKPGLWAYSSVIKTGARIRVTNPANSRSVIVTIAGQLPKNERSNKDHSLDLSSDAAENIQLDEGPQTVSVEVLLAPRD
jgi:hypothetical protein